MSDPLYEDTIYIAFTEEMDEILDLPKGVGYTDAVRELKRERDELLDRVDRNNHAMIEMIEARNKYRRERDELRAKLERRDTEIERVVRAAVENGTPHPDLDSTE